jgi:peptidoglycan/LPS O-acetylase OafA/YrhL
MKDRLVYLDGLRGVAALVVVFFHFFSAFLPSFVPDQTARPYVIADTPIAILYNGTFSVMIFFVLSGFVIANSAARKDRELVSNLVLRYTRLALPATASVLFAWVLLKLMPNEALRLYSRIPHPWLTLTFQSSIPGPGSALWAGLVRTFLADGTLFNNVLWTMQIELVGSCALYFLYPILKGKHRFAALLFLALLLPASNRVIYEGFVFGAILRELWVSNRMPKLFPLGCFTVGVLFGSVSTGFHQRYLPHVPEILQIGNKFGIAYPIAAALIVYGCIMAPSLRSVFSCRPARFLGRISFGLYLFHVPLLYTIVSAVVLRLWPVGNLSLTLLFAAFVCLAIGVGYLATVAVDEPVLKMNAQIRAWEMGRALPMAKPIDTAAD